MRLQSPIGIYLLFWPCAWAVAFASRGGIEWGLVLLFLAGSIVMRSAGCVINDIIDRKIDAEVERTKDRPLASGELSVRQAVVLLGILLFLGLLIVLQLNTEAILVAVCSLLLVVIYPFSKRFIYWPQLVLAFTFNIGALVGWVAVRGELSIAAWFIYAAGIFWTLGYDTIYAHQDKRDDVKAGVKSTAVLLGEATKPFVALCYAAVVACLAYVGALYQFSVVFYMGVALVAVHLGWQVYRAQLDNPRDCMQKFCSNSVLGAIVFFTLVIEKLL
jgi:4-hydroxybenzoate polyprenyltransferase